MPENRKDILLRAAFDMIRKQDLAHFVLDCRGIETFYDDAMCDGYCLMDDIAVELGIESDSEPLEENHEQKS